MGKKTPAAPAVPDYAAAARDQGTANLTAAQQGSVLSNPNIRTPYGNQTVTYAQDPNLPGGGSQATVTQTLTDAAQANLDAQQQVELAMSNLGLQGVGRVRDVFGKDFVPTNQNPLRTSIGNFGQAGSIAADKYGQAGSIAADRYGQAQGFDAGQYGQAGSISADKYGQAGSIAADRYGLAQGIDAGRYGQALQNFDTSNVARMPVNAGTTGQEAIMQRLAPQLQRQSAATEQRLANQGIMQGSEAYRNAMTDQGQQQNDLLSQAALQGINLDMSANQQGFNQAAQQGGFYNTGLGQNFGQGLQANQALNAALGQNFGQGIASQQLQNAAIGQNFGQSLAAQQLLNSAIAQNVNAGLQGNQASNAAIAQNFGQGTTAQQLQNAAIGQNFGQGTTAQQIQNAAIGQNFNQGMQEAQFGNAAQQAQLQQDLALRNQPLNEITALMSGAQIQNPQFQAFSGQNVAAAPVFQGAQAQAQAAQDVYGQQMAARNAAMQGLGSAIGGIGGMFNPINLMNPMKGLF
tara:strand:+ start:3299 stop:4855 length:1557 start_codon:yes stop_codon:yes gene_type:complete